MAASILLSYYVFKFLRHLKRVRTISQESFWWWNKLARYPYYYKLRYILFLMLPAIIVVALY